MGSLTDLFNMTDRMIRYYGNTLNIDQIWQEYEDVLSYRLRVITSPLSNTNILKDIHPPHTLIDGYVIKTLHIDVYSENRQDTLDSYGHSNELTCQVICPPDQYNTPDDWIPLIINEYNLLCNSVRWTIYKGAINLDEIYPEYVFNYAGEKYPLEYLFTYEFIKDYGILENRIYQTIKWFSFLFNDDPYVQFGFPISTYAFLNFIDGNTPVIPERLKRPSKSRPVALIPPNRLSNYY